jgi:hypothetical protein
MPGQALVRSLDLEKVVQAKPEFLELHRRHAGEWTAGTPPVTCAMSRLPATTTAIAVAVRQTLVLTVVLLDMKRPVTRSR